MCWNGVSQGKAAPLPQGAAGDTVCSHSHRRLFIDTDVALAAGFKLGSFTFLFFLPVFLCIPPLLFKAKLKVEKAAPESSGEAEESLPAVGFRDKALEWVEVPPHPHGKQAAPSQQSTNHHPGPRLGQSRVCPWALWLASTKGAVSALFHRVEKGRDVCSQGEILRGQEWG